MTAQVPESLVVGGHRLSLYGEPLSQWLSTLESPPEWPRTATCCWRGYVGTWKVENEKLYLVNVEPFGAAGQSLAGVAGFATFGSDTSAPAPSLQALFPEATGPVFADWYNGPLICPEGKPLKYVHMGYFSLYERERRFWVENGCIVSARLRDHVALGVGDDWQDSRPETKIADTRLEAGLIAAYVDTSYCATTELGEITLRIGTPSESLKQLFSAHVPFTSFPD